MLLKKTPRKILGTATVPSPTFFLNFLANDADASWPGPLLLCYTHQWKNLYHQNTNTRGAVYVQSNLQSVNTNEPLNSAVN